MCVGSGTPLGRNGEERRWGDSCLQRMEKSEEAAHPALCEAQGDSSAGLNWAPITDCSGHVVASIPGPLPTSQQPICERARWLGFTCVTSSP